MFDKHPPPPPVCPKCGEISKHIRTTADSPPLGQIFHVYECKCGERILITEKR